MDPLSVEEMQKKVSPVTVALIAILLVIGFMLGRLSYKMEAQDERFHEEITEINHRIDYFNDRVDRKMKNHEEAFHKWCEN